VTGPQRHTFTVYPCLRHEAGAARGSTHRLTFARLASLLATPREYPADGLEDGAKRAKPDDLPLLGLYETRTGQSTTEDVIGGSLLGIDYDSGTTSIDDALTLWASIAPCALHTSWNHSPDRPRFRIFLELSRVATPAEFREVYTAIVARAERAGHTIDRACSNPARRWYVGAHRIGQPFVHRFDGSAAPLDVDRALGWVASSRAAQVVPVAPRLPRYESASVRERRGRGWLERIAYPAVRNAPHGTRNAALWRYGRTAGGLVAAGYLDPSEAAAALLDAILANDGDPVKDRRVIALAIADGQKSPIELPNRPRTHAAERIAP